MLHSEPSKKQVGIWRRLKGMGAVYLQSGVCLLPKTDDHVRRLKLLENDVTGMGGEAVILETAALDRVQEEKVVARPRPIATRNIGSFSTSAPPSRLKSPKKPPSAASLTLSCKKTMST